MASAWKIASDNFRNDDGSLPTVEFAGLRPNSIAAIYEFIAENGHCVTESPTLWDEAIQADVPLLSVDDPCRLVQDGRVACFHCCYAGISINGVTIPVLGIFVFRDSIELDFRMGRDWNDANVDAFFCDCSHT